MSQSARHGIGEWCKAIAASVSLGALVGLICAGVTAARVYASSLPRDALVASSCAIGGIAGVVTVAYFLRLFSLGDVDAGDIWKSVGKAFIAFGQDAP